ncbi:MAG: nucleotidyltransferase domain-containing protein [Pseudomonadota bacterium]|nr:nucleotidyltransferase domain-containing protein [Pseudomonadota bacterium]
MPVQLDRAIQEEILRYCQVFVPEAEVFVFGSRAIGKATPRSDLDLALRAPQAIPLERIYQLKNVFSNSNIPQRIDVIDLNAVTPDFRAVVEAQMVRL